MVLHAPMLPPHPMLQIRGSQWVCCGEGEPTAAAAPALYIPTSHWSLYSLHIETLWATDRPAISTHTCAHARLIALRSSRTNVHVREIGRPVSSASHPDRDRARGRRAAAPAAACRWRSDREESGVDEPTAATIIV